MTHTDVAPRSDPEHSVATGRGVLLFGACHSGLGAVSDLLHGAGLSRSTAFSTPELEASSQVGDGPGAGLGFDFNGRLLDHIGWRWDRPSAVPMDSHPECTELVRQGRTHAERTLSAVGRWHIADPRLSLLLPWWRKVLDDRFVGLLVVRDPIDVAWRLALRQATPVASGLALWASYHCHALHGITGLPVVIVDFSALTARPNAVVPQLIDGLSELGVAGPFDRTAAAEAISVTRPHDTRPTLVPASGQLQQSTSRDHARLTQRPVGTYRQSSEQTMPPPTGGQAFSSSSQLGSLRLTVTRADLAAASEELALVRSRLEAREDDIKSLSRNTRSYKLLVGAYGTEMTLLDESLDNAVELLRHSEHSRDAHATLLLASSRTTLGRVNHRWAQLQVKHPQSLGRLNHLLGAAWSVVTLRRPWWLRYHPLFDGGWYSKTNPDIATGRLPPWWHYIRHGLREGRKPNPYFDIAWYQDAYPEVPRESSACLNHYLDIGAWAGKNPGPDFDSLWYLRRYADVAAAGINPLVHFLRAGRHEGRTPLPDSSGRDQIDSDSAH